MAERAIVPSLPTPLVSLKSVSKTFGGIHALESVSFDIYAGDVIGLVGDNGAGKSTLIKILSGAHEPPLGEIELEGNSVTLARPVEAQRIGVETVYQDLSLISAFTAAENVFLGRELSLRRGPALFKLMRRKAMADATVRSLKDLHIDIPGLRGRPVERMSGGQRQLVAIARGAFWGGKLLLLDEPTAALGVRESREVLELIKRLSARGLTVVMVTHNLEHLWQVCNRVVVMRRGRKAADMSTGETTMEEVVAYITGAWEPGLTFSLELVRWFAEMQIPCFVTDTLANETTYEPNSGLMLVLHAALMRNLGVVFTEMAWLDDLAADCAEERQYDGLYAASPVQVSCGTGGALNPIFIK